MSPSTNVSGKKVLFGLTGSIACYKSCHVISRLIQVGVQVQAACTAAAFRFIGPATLEGLTGKSIYSDIFATSRNIEHIVLSEWYDLAIVCPATGNTINKMASGMGNDPITCLFLANNFTRPWLVAPAMNMNMYTHPRTQESLQKLASWGVRILDTGTGHQACGTVGPGRLLEPEVLLDIIIHELEKTE